ncbi:hypothetical protein GCM10009817_37920 [Terrabacter lapilli]|uniref:Uncharacterized protein n=1 Tax=Terrabacter lapilli TaxID=436231 RepID=A0ABP5EBG0_9MICO
MNDPTTTTPARVRTDATAATAATAATPATAATGVRSTSPAAVAPTISRTTVRRLGLVLTTGAALWSASIFVYGSNATGLGGRIGDVTGFLFQLGVFALLTVMLRTGATGTSRAARVMIRVEYVLLGLASTWSLLHGLGSEEFRQSGLVMALDAFWPLSMLGMFVIGIKVAVAGRWRGGLRVWPLLAETWAVVTVPTFLLFGDPVANWVGGTHLLLGYMTLGILLTRRPELTGAQH